MIPNMRFYVISIVSIFLALAIGIYIGFSLDAKDVLVEQKEDIVAKLEDKFDFLKDENISLKKELEHLELENYQYETFSKVVYSEAIKGKLTGVKVSIIETNDDYIYSGIGKTLETAGATVVNITTIKDKFLNEELLKDVYVDKQSEEMKIEDAKINYIGKGIEDLSEAIIYGEDNDIIQSFKEDGIINVVGNFSEPVDYIIIAGGSDNENLDRINNLDKKIINISNKANIPIIGIEKIKVNYSYIDEYKNSRISTVDNVDTTIGKVSLIMAMEGRPGNYGVKPSAENLLPQPNDSILE